MSDGTSLRSHFGGIGAQNKLPPLVTRSARDPGSATNLRLDCAHRIRPKTGLEAGTATRSKLYMHTRQHTSRLYITQRDTGIHSLFFFAAVGLMSFVAAIVLVDIFPCRPALATELICASLFKSISCKCLA